MLLSAALWTLMYLDNRGRRLKAGSASGDDTRAANEAVLSGLRDETDKENILFRYTY